MVGLKTFWITISALLMLASCVPQTKKSECGSNEAFNTTLRACVPVVQTPGQFINITSFSPSTTYQRYRLSSDPMNFRVYLSNPYSRPYTIRWTHNYNGIETVLSNSLSVQQTIIPSSIPYTSQIGTHSLTAEILDVDSGSAVVDSHIFIFAIDNMPKPTITGNSPSQYNQVLTPIGAAQPFTINISNNNSSTLGYRVHWQLFYQTGGEIASPVWLATPASADQAFAVTSSTGTHTNTVTFDPGMIGIGSYFLKGRIVYSGTSIVEERTWDVVVKHPDLGRVTNITSPANGDTTIAYDNLNYTLFPADNWRADAAPTQSQFCVTVSDGDGTYSADGQGVQVRWYLNGSVAPVCTKETNDSLGTGPQTLCLTDANLCDTGVPFNTALLVFDNPSADETRDYKIQTRIFDRFSSQQYAAANVDTAPFSYPIDWTVRVKPINAAPVATFTPTQPIGCTTVDAFTYSGCLVDQGSNFTIGFSVTDDFYDTLPGDEAQYSWNVQLKKNGADLNVTGITTSCTKAVGVAVPAYTTEWTCDLQVPHFDANGPLDPTDSYSVVLILSDSGSPVGGSPKTAIPLTWGLSVTETNINPLIINAQISANTDSHVLNGATVINITGTNHADELSSIVFRPTIQDPERDDLQVRISVCTTMPGCTTSTPIMPLTLFERINFPLADRSALAANFAALSYVIPEDLLLTVGHDILTGANAAVTFKVEAEDRPHTPVLAKQSDSELFTVYVENINPAPAVATTSASPSISPTPLVVFSGFPLTIDPGTVSDTSGPASEKIITHQWYASVDAGTTWNAIPGAINEVLYWTPNHTIASNIQLKLCVGDRPAANPVDPANAIPNCSGVWNVTPVSNLADVPASTNMGDYAATWHDSADGSATTEVYYTAYINDLNEIFVNKIVRDISNNLTTTFETVTFPALALPATAGIVSNISIAGNADSLYIAYIASDSSTPGDLVPRVRRIDKSFSVTVGTKAALAHPGKFGFNYAHYTFNSGTCSTCTYTNSAAAGSPALISFSAAVPNGQTVVINGATFTAASSPADATQFCSDSTCPSGTATAASLRDAINNSTQAGVQGITASVSGANLQLHGLWTDDALELTGIRTATGGMGKIFIVGTQWFLPIIDATRVGAAQNNVTLIKGNTNDPVTPANPIGVASSSPFSVELDSGKASVIDTGLNAAGDFVVALISADVADAGAAKLRSFTYDGGSVPPSFITTPAASLDLFQSPLKVFEQIKLAPGVTGNTNVYVLAKEQAGFGGEWNLGRYTSTFGSSVEGLFSTYVDLTDSTEDFTDDALIGGVDDTLMTSPEIFNAPNIAEARILFLSRGTGTDLYPRIAKVSSGMTVSCGTCERLTETMIKPGSQIGVSHVQLNAVFGEAGNTPAENTKDTLYALWNLETVAGTTYRPQFGVLNIEGESILAANVDTTNNLWRPPFVK